MTENKLSFLKYTFPQLDIQFADDFSKAIIINPYYNENITVYDDDFEFTVYFSFQHCHLTNNEKVIDWINNIINGEKLAIEFFNKEQRRFGGEIEAVKLQDLSYEKLEQFTGYYGSTKLLDVSDSFKVRGWNKKNNFDFNFFREENGNITLNKTYVDLP